MSNFEVEDALKNLAINLLGFAACGLNINTAKSQYKELLRSQGLCEDKIDNIIIESRKWYKNRLLLIGLIGASLGYTIRSFVDFAIIKDSSIVLMYAGLVLVLIQMSDGLNFNDIRPTGMADLIRKRK